MISHNEANKQHRAEIITRLNLKFSSTTHDIIMNHDTRPVVLITAGSAGLGAAASKLFAKRGYIVIINYNSNHERASRLLAEISVEGGPVHKVIKADLASRNEVERLITEAFIMYGRLDAVFSNCGWTAFRDTSRLSDNVFDEDWDRAFIMNVKSHLWLLHAAEEHLSKQDGAFVTTASLAGVNGMGSSLAYSAAKAAQIHMVRGLAAMVGPNIRVNSVSPGLLETEWAERFTTEQKQATLDKTKLKRFATVEDVAEQVFGLVKSKSITGVNIVIDAGVNV